MFRIQALRGKGRIRYVSRWRTASVLVSDLDDRRKRSNHCLLINTSQRYQNVRCLHGVGKNYYCNLDRSSSSSSFSSAAAAAAASSSSSSDYGNNDQTAFTSTRFTPVSSHFLLSRASNLLTYPQIPSFHFNLTACPNLTTISIKSFSTKPTTNTNTATNHTTTTGTTTTTTKLTKKKSKSGKKVKKISRTPSWLNEEQAATHETILRAVKNVPKQLWNVTIKCIKWTLKCIRNPSYFKETMSDIWAHTKSEFQRYKLGTKLLVADIKVASNIIKRVLQGYSLSRRERKQLKITAMDILRVGPLFMFIIIPGMEFALPFAVKTFPNMLPSTFRETLKTQEDKKKLLRARIEMTAFFQDTMREFAEESKRKAKGRQKQLQRLAEEKKRELLEREQEEEDYVYHPPTIDGKDQEKATIELNRASKLLDSIDKIREGAAVDVDTIIEMSQLFKDGITLDTVSRSHLVAMCKYMGLNAFGSDPYLRYQLRSAIRGIRNDDQSILWEGPESLSTDELKTACEERGMRASGLSRDQYLNQLQHWLDMSVNKNVPLTLLVMSRAFLFTTEDPSAVDEAAALQEAVSQLDEDVIVDAVIEATESGAAMSATPMDPEEAMKEREVVSKLKLDRMERQMELIEEERKEAKEIEKEKERGAEEKTDDPFKEKEDIAVELKSSNGHAKTDIEHGISERFDEDDEAIKDAKAEEQTKIKKQKTREKKRSKEKKREDRGNTFVLQKDSEGVGSGEGKNQNFSLTHAEIEALESLATNSAVTFERSLFEKLKLLKREAEVADVLSQTSIKRHEQEDVEEESEDEDDKVDMTNDLNDYKKDDQFETSVDDKDSIDHKEDASLTSKLKESATKIVKGDITVLEDLKESASKIADDVKDQVKDTIEGIDPSDDDASLEDAKAENELVKDVQDKNDKEADILRRGRSRLEKMINKLEAELNEVDQEIGRSLNVLDQNKDGMCTTGELRNAFKIVLKEDDMSKADSLINIVDPNNKGYFNINELHELLETLEEDDVDMEIFEYLGGKNTTEEL